MKRLSIKYLKDWLNSSSRQPLIIRGARQVGKTWLVRYLAECTGKQLVELNFEKNPGLTTLFNSNEPQQILINVESFFGKSINSNTSLLFLDEIQAAPELLSKLRWFAEEYSELPVIAAGSLLEFVLEEHSFSMPVGRISYMHLEPLSFEEYLLACDKERLYHFILNFTWNDIPELIHQELIKLFKEYLIIGGMPAAVATWIKTHSLSEVNQIHYNLLATYRDDFAKYAGRLAPSLLEDVLNAVPRMLSEKFIYSRVNQDVQSTSIKKALDLLIKARLCHPVISSASNGVPIAAELKQKMFKIILLDVGLVSSMLRLNLNQINAVNEIDLINQGAISEQVAGQLLRTILPEYMEPALYYWTRQKKGSSSEVDYVIQHQSQVVPIEIKSGKTGTLKSLHIMMASKKLDLAVRFNSDLPSKTPVHLQAPTGETAKYQLLSLPFYLIGQIERLLQEIASS